MWEKVSRSIRKRTPGAYRHLRRPANTQSQSSHCQLPVPVPTWWALSVTKFTSNTGHTNCINRKGRDERKGWRTANREGGWAKWEKREKQQSYMLAQSLKTEFISLQQQCSSGSVQIINDQLRLYWIVASRYNSDKVLELYTSSPATRLGRVELWSWY